MRDMRESGFVYLGEIPDHWRIERIKNHLCFSPDKNPGDAMVLSLYREHGIVPKDSRDDNHNVTSEDTSNYRYVQVGDFVVNKMKAWQGSMGVSGYEGVVSPAYYVYRFTTDDFDKKYLHYLLRSKCYADEFRRLSGGIRIGQWDLPKVGFETTYVSVPPKGEQIVIAEYIDAQLNKVDTLVVNVQAQIEKLKAYKQSLITEVVTKGLDPTVTMKDSGVEWIGNIPAHWKTTRIKYVLDNSEFGIKCGPFGSALTGKVIDNGAVTIYGQWNIVGGDFSIRRNTVSEADFDSLSSYYVQPNDVLVSMMGTIGRCAIVPQNIAKGIMDSHVIKIRLNESCILPPFFWYEYDKNNSAVIMEYYNRKKKGFIMDGLNTSIIKNAVFILPPLEDQKEIVEYLNRKCSKIEQLISLKEAKIEKLEQYKKSLIYEYVTGKKEVH